MTQFGARNLQSWFRVRAVFFAAALVLAVAASRLGPAPVLAPLLALLALDLGLSLVGGRLTERFSPRRVVLGLMLLDVLAIFFIILNSGGLQGGFAALYVMVVFSALLMLGQRAALLFALIGAGCFVLQLGLELSGVLQLEAYSPLPIELAGQGMLLGILIVLALFLARSRDDVMQQLHLDTDRAKAASAQAEHAQQQWMLIHNVALRVQESTTPQQVYESVGDELERIGLHCAVLEWAEPGVSFRIAHLSAGKRALDAAETLHLDLQTFRIRTAEATDLADALSTRMTRFVPDVAATASPLLGFAPAPVLKSVLNAMEVHGAIYAPMLMQGNAVGVLVVWGKELSESDCPSLAALARQAASALEKARFLTEQKKRAAQLELVNNIAARVSAAESADEILGPLVKDVGTLFGYEVVSVLLVDAADNQLELAAHYSTLRKLELGEVRIPIERGIVGWVIRHNSVYLARDTRQDPHYFSPKPYDDPIRSELTVPLHAQDRVIGALDIESSKLDAFDESDVNALTLLGEQVSAALSKTRALALEQKRAAQLALVSEIAARAAAYSDPDAIVRTMVQLVQERFGYHHVCVAVYDATRNEMEQQYAAGLNAEEFPPGKRWSAEMGMMGLAARTRQTVYSGDMKHDPRVMVGPDKEANSALCVPLVAGKQVLGVLDVESVDRYAFDANDIGAMETLANQMAAALEKARSLQAERRRAAQMALVNRIASRTARLVPMTQLVRDAVELIRAQFGYFNVAVFVTLEGNQGVRMVATAGGLSAHTNENETLTEGIIALVARTGNAYLCGDTRADPRYVTPLSLLGKDPVRSELSVPLRRGEKIIGVLDMQSETPNDFSPGDVTALEALADQLAAALENARLYESEAQRAAELEAVRVLSLELTAERDLDVVLNSIVRSAAQLVQAEGSALYIVDEQTGELTVRISLDMERNYVGYRMKVGEGLAGRAVERKEPLIVADYSTWEGRSGQFQNHPLERMMAVPLIWQDRVLGVINLHRSAEAPVFGAEQVRLASLFAIQAAIAMENARLVSALETRLEAQQVLSESSAHLLELTEPQGILEEAAEAAVRVLDCDGAIVYLPGALQQLDAHAFAGRIFAEQTHLNQLREPVEATIESLPGRAFVLQAAQFEEAAEDSRPAWRVRGYVPTGHAGLAVPMRVGDDVIGVLVAHSARVRRFDETEAQTLSLLADQTASALERARYFVQVQGRVRELNLLFEGARATSSTLNPTEVIDTLLRQLLASLDLTSAYFVRMNGDTLRLQQTHEAYAERATAVERTPNDDAWSMGTMQEIRQVLAGRVLICEAGDPGLSAEMREYMRSFQVQTILRVPLSAADEVLGYVSLWDSAASRKWSPDAVRFVQTLCSQAAAALVNAQLYQAARARTRELQALHDASRVINNTLDIRSMCESSVDALREILGYPYVSIYFVAGDHLVMQAQRGYKPEDALEEIPLTRGVMARAVNTRQTVFLEDVREAEEFLAALPSAQSEIAVPLLAGERVWGVLNVETARTGPDARGAEILTRADVQLLTTFANQLVVALENARLFQQSQQGLAQVRILHAASQTVNADLELQTVLERVARQFVSALDVDFCTLLEMDAAEQNLVVLFDYEQDPRDRVDEGTMYPLSTHAYMGRLMAARVSTVFRIDDPTLELAMRANMERFRSLTELVVPLISKGRVIGIIELGDRKHVRDFRRDEVQLAESLASQAAVALVNARLYHTARQRLQETETLYRFARDLGGTLDIQQLGKRALEAASRLAEFDVGEVCLVRESDGALVPLVVNASPGLLTPSDFIPRGRGIMGWVAEHGQAVRLDDVTNDPRYFPISTRIRSEVCLPLRAGERVIGVLNLESVKAGAFDAHTEELLIVFANQLAISIENARLYEQTKRDSEVKAALLREISHRVKNNLAAITSLLYLALDEPAETREQILGETLGRVQSMALAHALLARSGEGQVNLKDLGRQVLSDAARNLTQPGAPVQVHVDGDIVFVGARQTTTLALVLNELATNSLRHGFNVGDKHMVRTLGFDVRYRLDKVTCTLTDNGTGLPNGFAVDQAAGLGLNLVRTLVEKDLHGRFYLEGDSAGTRAEICFQPEEPLTTLQ